VGKRKAVIRTVRLENVKVCIDKFPQTGDVYLWIWSATEDQIHRICTILGVKKCKGKPRAVLIDEPRAAVIYEREKGAERRL